MLSADGVYHALKGAFEYEAEIGFRAFVRGNHTTKWVIAADFVTGGPKQINDTFAFTVYPYEDDSFVALLAANCRAIPADLKRVKQLYPDTAAFLADRRRFHFCFIPNKGRHGLGSWEITQATLAELADHIQGWPNTPTKPYYIRKFDHLIQRAKKNKFNYCLLHDITLLSALSAYIAMLIAKHSHPDVIMFAFDRDAMTTAYDGIVYDLAHLNFHSVCDLEYVPRSGLTVANAIDPTAKNGESTWFDDLIRAPDYIAGAMAQWDFWTIEGNPVSPKVADVIALAISENPNLIILTIQYTLFRITCSRARAFSKANPNRSAYNYASDATVDYLAWTILRGEKHNRTTYRQGISNTSSINSISLRIWQRPVGRF